ncbi:MAG TPA: hypothetical protein VFG20_10420 [Planctomycetaceae bacterium]|nr:hypothetical protein [Planctomycetaceae bacterium]
MWFTEDPWTPMLFCGIGVLIGVGMWANSRRVLHLGIAVMSLVCAGAIFAIEQAIVTPAEEVEQEVVRLCDDFRRKDPKTLDHFSPTASELRALAESGMAMLTVGDDLSLTDFQTKVTNQGSRAESHFRANATISVNSFGNAGRQPARLILTWAKEGNEWKVIGVKRLNPINGQEIGVLNASAG